MTPQVNEQLDKIGSVREEGDISVEEVLFQRHDLQVCLDATASKLLGACISLGVEREQLEQHGALSPSSRFRLESLLSSSVSRFIDDFARFVTDELAAHHARPSMVVTSASRGLKLDS